MITILVLALAIALGTLLYSSLQLKETKKNLVDSRRATAIQTEQRATNLKAWATEKAVLQEKITSLEVSKDKLETDLNISKDLFKASQEDSINYEKSYLDAVKLLDKEKDKNKALQIQFESTEITRKNLALELDKLKNPGVGVIEKPKVVTSKETTKEEVAEPVKPKRTYKKRAK